MERLMTSKLRPRVFISYSTRNKRKIKRIAEALKEAGIDVWIDLWEISVGDSITSSIAEALNEADYLVVALSRASIASPWVSLETGAALIRELREHKNILLPILLEPCDIPIFLSHKKYADFTKGFEYGLDELMRCMGVGSLEADFEQLSQTVTPQQVQIILEVDEGRIFQDPVYFDDEEGVAPEVQMLFVLGLLRIKATGYFSGMIEATGLGRRFASWYCKRHNEAFAKVDRR
jgi:hypothetical protein